jgi:plastocyanin
MRTILVTLGAAAAALAVTAAAPASTTVGTLTATDGPGFTITMSKKSIRHGAYTITVRDRSSIHNFHLIGPGVDQAVTSVPFDGEKTVTVTLTKGTYTYQCDPHASQGMKGTFEVT